MHQDELFPEAPPGRRQEPPPRAKPQSTSICHYCGRRLPSALMRSTPAVDEDPPWTAIAPYHEPDCRWIGPEACADRRD